MTTSPEEPGRSATFPAAATGGEEARLAPRTEPRGRVDEEAGTAEEEGLLNATMPPGRTSVYGIGVTATGVPECEEELIGGGGLRY